MIIQDGGKSKRIGKSGLDILEQSLCLPPADFRERIPVKIYSLCAFMTRSRLCGILSSVCSCCSAS